MDTIQNLYLQFLSFFPPAIHPIVSVALAVLLVYAIIQVLRKDWIYIIVLVILLPASIPILKNLGQSVLDLIKFFLHTK